MYVTFFTTTVPSQSYSNYAYLYRILSRYSCSSWISYSCSSRLETFFLTISLWNATKTVIFVNSQSFFFENISNHTAWLHFLYLFTCNTKFLVKIYISLKTFIPLNTLLLTKLLTQSYIKNDEKLWQLLLKITICDTKPKVAIFS